jgi:hypothetical protein
VPDRLRALWVRIDKTRSARNESVQSHYRTCLLLHLVPTKNIRGVWRFHYHSMPAQTSIAGVVSG